VDIVPLCSQPLHWLNKLSVLLKVGPISYLTVNINLFVCRWLYIVISIPVTLSLCEPCMVFALHKNELLNELIVSLKVWPLANKLINH